MGVGTLIGYFAKQGEARKALHDLNQQGFSHITMAHKRMDGTVQISAPSPWQFLIRKVLSVQSLFKVSQYYGVHAATVREYALLLVPGESCLVLKASLELLQRPMILLRESCDPPPALFVIHPAREHRAKNRGTPLKLTPPQIFEHAQRHAREQRVDWKPYQTPLLLKRIKQIRHWIRRICSDLAAASRLEQKTTPAADWILDNEYILEGNARDVLLNLPRGFYQRLPALTSQPYQGLPCTYGLAKDLVSHTELRLDQETILSFIEVHQTVRTLTIGELWAIPQMLRIALIEAIQGLAVTALNDLRERQLADLWANRLIAANRSDSTQLFAVLAALGKAEPSPSPYFGTQLIGLLYDEAVALAPVQIWLERMLKTSLQELALQEQDRQNREQALCGNAFTSLRQLALLDWREMFEQLSRVEQVLRRDPSGIYPNMDFATRDRCRRVIEALASAASLPEEHVAEQAIKLAAQAGREVTDDDRLRHVGTWLLGQGRVELSRLITCQETTRYRLLQWIYNHHNAVYGAGVTGFLTLFLSLIFLFVPAGLSGAVQLGLLLLLLIPVSQLAIEVVNYLITRLLPPRTLPKMDFEDSGIPDAFCTLVVVPMMLVNAATVHNEVEKLEIRYLANKEANLFFSLFTDYTDSVTLSREDDDRLLHLAQESLEALNQRHGDHRFFLFHRERTWSDSEQKFIGWERKRGKLEELNRLIDGTRPKDAERLVYLGEPDQLADVRFVITLDSDTQLPHGTARRMIETLAHPLNQPRLDAAGAVMAGSYTIIQPRVSPSLSSTSASTFSRLFADAIGIDPYTQAVSDLYQDLSGEGSYHGKGIYDVRVFSRVLSERFPEACILSHDLIEGAHVRVGLASDIELFDEFPQGYQGYSSRSHRWIRGDWQIAGWIFPWVPQASGGYGKNPLSLLNRWKIFDNLRRSLLPATTLGLVVTSWFISPIAGLIASLVAGIQLLFHPLAQPFTMATTPKGLKYFSPAKLLHDLMRATVDAALLPHQAAVSLDAIIRVWYRRMISQRDLLEWAAQATHWSRSRRQPAFVANLALGSLFSCLVGVAVWQISPVNLLQSLPWLILWFISPLLGWVLNQRPIEQHQTKQLPESDRLFLRQAARRTWRYFSCFVNNETSWLPPDNYQVAHQNRLAMRTSPTNIGLWMTSVLGAHDFGYLTLNQVVETLTSSMASINRLERFEGHLLNWYDIKTLAPLEPRYVSTVDSGNLLGALWALEQGLDELLHAPLMGGTAFSGMADIGEVLKQSVIQEGVTGFYHHTLETLLRSLHTPPSRIADLLRLQQWIQTMVDSVCSDTAVVPWVLELEQQVAAWAQNSDRYLTWIELLAERAETELAQLGPEALLAIRQDLIQAPSLFDLAHGQIGSIIVLRRVREQSPQSCTPIDQWIDRVLDAFAPSQWLAGETLALAEQLITDVRALSAGMNMGFLYESKRKLFTIGYNISRDRLDSSRYDLLASEARLGSFVAIARGDVPLEHWFSMSRPYGAIGRQRVLLSWTGTMFEYLMPLLFQQTYNNSLLDKAAQEAVAVQISYGNKHHIPWGISESAFADLDFEKTYQYKAFGVPTLGLKRGLEEQLVVAPYATLLALNVAPNESIQNLKQLAEMGMLGEYGYYESMDFSRQPQRDGGNQTLKRGVIVEAYMAHHQGMAFLALTNFLHDNPFPRRFHRDPRVRAFESLLQERIPTLPPLHLVSTRQGEPQIVGVNAVAPAVITFTTPHTSTPRSLLLGNGHYSLMVTNSGGGYSQCGGQELTRWRSDQTCDSQGTFCYIHETDPDNLWSTAWHPTGKKPDSYTVDFALDRALFRRVDNGIHTETEIVVSPDDDLEIRLITLVNRSARISNLELTSYVELSMAPHAADRQHPAFNKLFIQTEALPDQQTLLASRRPRSDHELPLYLAHALVLHQADSNPHHHGWQFETDRKCFIGRGRTLANPMGATQVLGSHQGFVLDPILALRQGITLKPGQRVQLSLLLASGSTREQVVQVVESYRTLHSIERAMDAVWNSARQQLQQLRIQPDEARRFQQLASHLLFPNRLLRAPVERLNENRKGQAGLWPYAISGDLPMVLVTIAEVRDISLVRQLLQAHRYCQMQGFSTDLIILNEEAGGYERPLQEQLNQLIHTHVFSKVSDLPGEIFLKIAAQIPEEDLILLKTAASVMLVAARGTLPQQLGGPVAVVDQQQKRVKKRAQREPSAPLPFMELHYFNSLGGFTQDGREYAIYLGPGTNTPAPWVNVIANPGFGSVVSETGSGFSWFGNSQRNRLTGWSNDPVLDPASEAIYIRDEESGFFWSPTAAPIREESAYRARHGAGYTVFEHNSNGIEQELTVFVPVDENGGEPIKLQRLLLTNGSNRRRRLSVTYYVELSLAENRETSQMHVTTSWDETSQALMAHNYYHPEYNDRVAFVSMTPLPETYSGDRTGFIGRNRTLANPDAMELVRLPQRIGAGLDPCGAVQISIDMMPGEQRAVYCVLGQADSVAAARKLVHNYQHDLAFERAFDQTRAWWDDLLGTIEVQTPDLAANLLVNRWLQYQSLSCRIWGRSGFYQSGGAFGFRDQLQDVMAFLFTRPELARDQILLAASRQFSEGDVQHWWHPPTGAGIRSRISDDLLWLPHVVAQYVRTTGDLAILQTEIPFLTAPLLADDQHELFSIPEISQERASLFEHCKRAVSRGLTSGPLGLPLIGTGDWNDGMNLVGAGGKGESVWLAWFLCDLLQGMSELASLLQQPGLSKAYLNDRSVLMQQVEKSGWDGEWYLRGTFDDGSLLGSTHNSEARIDSLPQSWAWLSGAADPVRADQALESAWNHLVCQDEGMVLLFEPPFDKSEPSPGYIKGYPPGVRENGGQYTHAALWMAMAMARKGDGERAV